MKAQCTGRGFITCYPHSLVVLWPVVWVLLSTLGLWRADRGFIEFIEGLQMVYRRFQEDLHRAPVL